MCQQQLQLPPPLLFLAFLLGLGCLATDRAYIVLADNLEAIVGLTSELNTGVATDAFRGQYT